MKKAFILLGITAFVILFALITISCFSPWQDQFATITINLDAGNARSVINPLTSTL